MDLTVVEEFLNTRDERSFSVHGEKHVPSDRLTSVEALSQWFSEHGLPGRPLDATALASAVALREGLRGALATGEGADQALASFPLRLTVDVDGRLRMAADSGVAGLDAIVETVAAGVAGGAWKRLKLCASEDCRWAFYDTSRSGSGKWCDMDVCGNRHKTRAYRQRRG